MPSLNSWYWRFLENYVYAVPEPPPRQRTKPMQVLCVGPPRSGTESLQTALLTLGWFGSVDGNTNITKEDFYEILGHCVAVTDAAASVFAAELIAAYPDAKVVLNYRKDLDAWHESAIKTLLSVWDSWLIFALSCLGKELFWVWHVYRRFMWPGLFRALDGDIDSGIERNGKWVYKEHCNMIRGLVPKERLLEWTVQDGWEPLCKFLDKPIPDEPFPHVNKALGWDDRVAETSKRYMWSALPGLAMVTTVTIGLGAVAYKILL
ncbi:hypothetical protein HYE67_001609 [Fusarium culmorum]|uniref:NAD dependent epimerase/dehydratase n=1 Tax=Fusarium culmorum TaxID=5516 RepID=A0A7S8HS93_FUSCU|nr:hypothetical protein HYE67_001609 [Fusarium culmorum]